MKKYVQPRKYLQACEIGGSIYGKTSQKGSARVGNRNDEDKDDLISAYSDFYKRQFNAFDRVFRHKK